MRVLIKQSDDALVKGGLPSVPRSPWRRLQRQMAKMTFRSFNTANPVLHTPATVPSGFATELLASRDARIDELVHLHWVGHGMLSIEEIGRLPLPLVWTLHDQWALCGAEHYTSPPEPGETCSRDERFALGYSPSSRPPHESGPDLNRKTWLRKQRSWSKPISIVCPSHWLADCARRSSLMADWPITVIPYPIDLQFWAPVDQQQARALLQLPHDRPLVLFGALGGSKNPRKGADLLIEALKILHLQVERTSLDGLELVIFGQNRPANASNLGFPVRYTGPIQDDLRLRLLYAAADVFVIPSLQDNLPNTGIEAHACGTPVVAFRTCGLVDIVDERVTGALADPFDPVSLATQIRWVLEDSQRRRRLGASARQRAENLWDPARVAGLYAEVYEQAMERDVQNGSSSSSLK